jgi:hypothetical protein
LVSTGLTGFLDVMTEIVIDSIEWLLEMFFYKQWLVLGFGFGL